MVIGIDLDGRKDVLGMWIGEHETSKFWLVVLNELRNRGVQDILICCVDNLKGFSEAIAVVSNQVCKITPIRINQAADKKAS
jgi:putative transposase